MYSSKKIRMFHFTFPSNNNLHIHWGSYIYIKQHCFLRFFLKQKLFFIANSNRTIIALQQELLKIISLDIATKGPLDCIFTKTISPKSFQSNRMVDMGPNGQLMPLNADLDFSRNSIQFPLNFSDFQRTSLIRNNENHDITCKLIG